MYYFLCASLPMLKFGETPPYDSARLADACRGELDGRDYAIFEAASLTPGAPVPSGCLAARFSDWEIALRNRLVRRRAQQLDTPPEKFLRDEPEVFPELENLMQTLGGIDDPAEREKQLDLARWKSLDNLAALHDFDLDAVLAYKLKLELLEKAAGRNAETGLRNFEKLTGGGGDRAENPTL